MPPSKQRLTYRDDGWPICPQCDEDELACLVWPYDDTDLAEYESLTLEQRKERMLTEELYCYSCGRVTVEEGRVAREKKVPS